MMRVRQHRPRAFGASCRGLLAAACLAAGLGLPAGAALAETLPAAGPQWKVIVHPANPVRSMAREELERIYRRISRFWPDGSAILPLNLPGGDPLRRAFSEKVLRDSDEELATYWNREYFQGVAPPAVLRSANSVRAYVAATVNAIGYVPTGQVDASVAVVEVRGVD